MTDDPKKQARRRQILDAALQAFIEKGGYDKTSMDDIVRASGLSKGTLYWHFENKQELFAAVVARVVDDIGALFERIANDAQGLTPPERLRLMITGAMPMFDDMSIQFAGLYADFFAQAWRSESVQKAFTQAYVLYSDMIAEVVQQGIDDGTFRPVDVNETGRVIGGAVDSVFLQQLLKMGDSESGLKLLADIIIRGLMKGKS